MNALAQFHADLSSRMSPTDTRPFICDGDPLRCRVFIVGFNAASDLPFEDFWSDSCEFDRDRFLGAYRVRRVEEGRSPESPTRRRINRIIGHLPPSTCLETNLFSTPTKRAAGLTGSKRRTSIIEFLLHSVRPSIVYAYSKYPVEFFQTLTSGELADGEWQTVTFRDHQFRLLSTRKHLRFKSYVFVDEIGRMLRREFNTIE